MDQRRRFQPRGSEYFRHGASHHHLSPFQKNVDAVFMKDFRLGESKTAQVKVEMLNLFNRVNVTTASSNNITSSTFEQIGNQAGFMRITQVMFRYSF